MSAERNPWPPIRSDGKMNPLSPEWEGGNPFSDAALGETHEEFIARMNAAGPWTFVCPETDRAEMTTRCFSCSCWERR